MSSWFIRRANVVYSAGGRLPAEFTELEYIEGTGTQYIRLGISGNVTFNITAQCVTPSSSINQALVCSTTNGVGGCLENEMQLARYIKNVIDDPDAKEGVTFARWLATMAVNGIEIEWSEILDQS